eukprot:1161350-Pelagomonas_calceolata.AAC.9
MLSGCNARSACIANHLLHVAKFHCAAMRFCGSESLRAKVGRDATYASSWKARIHLVECGRINSCAWAICYREYAIGNMLGREALAAC